MGLIGAVVWNRRTGHLVGGHQRLAALDALEGKADYELDVAVVDLDDATEREQNVFLNNPAVHGDWDLAALATLMRMPDFSVEATGFDPLDVQLMFDDRDLAPAFTDASGAAALADLAAIGQVRPEDHTEEDSALAGAPAEAESKTPEQAAAEAALWADVKAKRKEQLEAAIDADDSEFYTVISCRDRKTMAVLCSALGIEPTARTLDGRVLMRKLGLTP